MIDTARALTRRVFIRKAGVALAATPLAAGMVAAACADDPVTRPPGAAAQAVATNTRSNMSHTTASTTPTAGGAMTADEMDLHHKEGVDLFLKNLTEPITQGKGNVPAQFRMEGNLKVFDLTIDEITWETAPGQTERARAYNAMIPGPVLRATVGERVRINVKNNLEESTAVHWHGLYVPNNQDGVPYVTQEPIKPGASFVYEFDIRNAGTHMYHSHHNSMDQVNRGLLGAFIVDPANPADYPPYDREYIMVLNDTLMGFTINGKGFPATDAVIAKKGERVLIRWMNEGLMNHPMHLHGMPMRVIQRDGWPVEPSYLCDTLDVPAGNRFDTIVEATEEGLWAFHCHILSHAESATGMFGLVTVFVVQA
jgi:FtsP/CotA-like multicopper oxidase with cupredoxin domain